MITAVPARRRAAITPPRWLPAALLAVVLAVVLPVVSAHVPPGHGHRAVDAFGDALLVIAGLAIGACRRWPRPATVVVTAVLCAYVARDYPNGPVWLTGIVVLAVLSWRTNRRTAVTGAIGMLVALTVTATTVGGLSAVVSLIYVGWTAAAVFLGEALRSRRNYLSGLAERARFAERSRLDETARRVAEERLRIARDLHDSVAHAMATINVQAGAAAHVLDRRPEAAGAALTAIQRASAEVLDELGSMLAVLRDGTARADRAPAPGVADIARLVDSVAPSGLTVDWQLDGSAQAIAPAMGTAAYRVVQESLTNVLRHSQARAVRVRVDAGPGAGLRLEVLDPGPARPSGTAGTGVGVRGMHERVVATGGRLEAGPTPDGGFAVRAVWDARG